MPATPKPAGHRLAEYWAKRDFARTSEPRGEPQGERGAATPLSTRARGRAAAPPDALSFVIQKHAASRLHYDFRLELGGVLLSWALPKGPSFDPADKRIAIHVEDHPLSYGSFEGTIPRGEYGAGSVIVWDRGTWEPVGDPEQGLAAGKLLFDLRGQKLNGRWELVNIAKGGERQEPWILFKKRDASARTKAEYDVLTALPDSVVTRPPTAPAATSRTPGAQAAPPARAASRASTPDRRAAKSEKPGAARRKARAGSGPSDIPSAAVEAAMPAKLSPQLATLAAGIPTQGEWFCEIKFDGYRIMARIEGPQVALVTRGGHDWSTKMPDLRDELARLGLGSAWLDGEIVVLGKDGNPSFNALQKSFDRQASAAGIVYFLFDLPYFEGHDLRQVPWVERRQLLRALVDAKGSERIRLSADFPGDPASVLQSACKLGLEGIILKRADAPYDSRRTETWLKLKCKQRQEFVVCGYTDRSDGSPQIGSLLLGTHDDDGALVSVGSVGTGWDTEEATTLKERLAKIERSTSPFTGKPPAPGRWSRRAAGSERWVEPKLVAEVEYAETTPDGQIRHASYLALRSDKPAGKVRRETARMPAQGVPLASGPAPGPIAGTATKVSHAERVIDASTGLTKLDLVRYYESVADFILPHLRHRPVSLVRGPTGVGGQLFFQKHSERTRVPGLKDMDPGLWPGHDALLEVSTKEAVGGAAQMNVIEFHTWNSTNRKIDLPDRMIYDLDPGEGTTWTQIQEAALLVRGLLGELGLESWLKTSGGKGLHVVVPLAPKADYDVVGRFSKAVVEHLARVIPSRFVAKSGAGNRIGKLFVDYLRNGHGATTAAAFSARARPGLGVSMPVSWDDLARLKGGNHWTIATAREHLSFQTVDPWAGYWKKRQTLKAAMKALGFETASRPKSKVAAKGDGSAKTGPPARAKPAPK